MNLPSSAAGVFSHAGLHRIFDVTERPWTSTLDNSAPNGFAYRGASRFFTVDVRMRYKVDRQWSLAVGIDNLNNDVYWNFRPYPQRTYSAELTYDY